MYQSSFDSSTKATPRERQKCAIALMLYNQRFHLGCLEFTNSLCTSFFLQHLLKVCFKDRLSSI